MASLVSGINLENTIYFPDVDMSRI